jgi:hypothetical protein
VLAAVLVGRCIRQRDDVDAIAYAVDAFLVEAMTIGRRSRRRRHSAADASDGDGDSSAEVHRLRRTKMEDEELRKLREASCHESPSGATLFTVLQSLLRDAAATRCGAAVPTLVKDMAVAVMTHSRAAYAELQRVLPGLPSQRTLEREICAGRSSPEFSTRRDLRAFLQHVAATPDVKDADKVGVFALTSSSSAAPKAGAPRAPEREGDRHPRPEARRGHDMATAKRLDTAPHRSTAVAKTRSSGRREPARRAPRSGLE